MRISTTNFLRAYAAALSKNLRDGLKSDLKGAVALGEEAVRLGLDTLALARIHRRAAVISLSRVSSNGSNKYEQKMEAFFAKAIIPIAVAHASSPQDKLRWVALTETLRTRAGELAVSKRELEWGIAGRKLSEIALLKKTRHHSRLMKESRLLDANLRRLTHHVISAREGCRSELSRNLFNEIGQGLLALNLRLSNIEKKGTRQNTELLTEIASIRLLVDKSTEASRSLLRKFRAAK